MCTSVICSLRVVDKLAGVRFAQLLRHPGQVYEVLQAAVTILQFLGRRLHFGTGF